MNEVSVALLTHYDRRLAEFGRRLQVLLALPDHVSIDPLRATDPESGKFIRESVLEIVDGVRKNLGLSVVVPSFTRWYTADRGPGIPRQQLRGVSDGIDEFRGLLASGLSPHPLCQGSSA